MKTFSAEELVKVAYKAVELCGIRVCGNDREYLAWCLHDDQRENGDTTFDCACAACGNGCITLDSMKQWDSLRAWCESEFNEEFELVIGCRGEYEDRYNTYCIGFKANRIEAEAERKAREIEREQRKAKRQLLKRNQVAHATPNGTAVTEVCSDIDALAALKAKFEKE